MDSMEVGDKGFEIVLADHSKVEVAVLMKFPGKKGGRLSQYGKSQHFFKELKRQKLPAKKLRFMLKNSQKAVDERSFKEAQLQ